MGDFKTSGEAILLYFVVELTLNFLMFMKALACFSIIFNS